MKIFILATVLTISALQAESIVHYDKKETVLSGLSKPNLPNADLYAKVR